MLAAFVLPTSGWGASTKNLDLIDPTALKHDEQAWVILDARPRSEWAKGHIPGAHSFSWEDYTRTNEKGIPYQVLPPDEMSAALGALGIDNRTPVVVYGDADTSWGGEGWVCWVLTWLGHSGPIRLLTGGVQAWHKLGYPLASGNEEVKVSPVPYQVKLRPDVLISFKELVDKRTQLTIIDTRSWWEWFTGHIPLAVHIPWKELYTGKDRHPLKPAEFKALLKKHGVNPERPVVYYCAAGVRSAYAWMVHELSGLPSARNYEGGMEEWKRRFFTYHPVQESSGPPPGASRDSEQ